ncbi:M1 family metallopeptidase [Actinocatenispora rupis]|uniref:Aminopeptidase N n=1 Tax=Actinocatenispora rupis TaxID=519421 RepID=A0A8J3J766_9ACTN|nr:M1 family metallopeptidase [Actinocatenispora rupis]GID12871.1 zinc metalloprotease [Actinocatenispora rupis]
MTARHRWTGAAAAGLLLGVLVGVPSGAVQATPPSWGAPGVGDPLFPTLGNGGFDVTHYDLTMRYDAASRTVAARTRVAARATQELTRFDLDFDGNTVTGVRVGGAAARWSRDGDELVVTPPRPVHRGAPFAVTVTYAADPRAAHDCAPLNAPTTSGWLPTPDGFVVAGQPSCARSVFPGSDHPSDKATYTFRLTAPRALTAVANGTLVSRRTTGDDTTWTYVEAAPMATELAQLAVGEYTVVTQRGPGGVVQRDVLPTTLADELRPDLSVTTGQLAWLGDRLGRYPFGEYGILAAPAEFHFALETQTLTLVSAGMLRFTPRPYWAPVLAHELAHQWFGDLVSPARWSDVWLNEGHATYYEAAYADSAGYASFTDRMRTAYRNGDSWRAQYGAPAAPRADDLFNDDVYDGGALVLYALHEKVGAATFQRIERAWLARYANGSAGTAQFVTLASQVAGRDLGGFLHAWLYGTTTPPMPGHPDWTS